MQSVSSRIWTRVAVSISYDDNHYTTGTSTSKFFLLSTQSWKKNSWIQTFGKGTSASSFRIWTLNPWVYDDSHYTTSTQCLPMIRVFWLISTMLLFACLYSSSYFKSSSPCINLLVTVPRAPVTIGITVTFMFLRFFNSLASLRYLSFFSFFFFNITLWSTGTGKSTIWQILFFLLIITRSVRLVEIRWFVCIPKSHRRLCVSFSRIDSVLCIYNLFAWSDLNFLHNSKWIPANSLESYILSTLIRCIRLLRDWLLCLYHLVIYICYIIVLSILALIWLVIMALVWVAIRRDSLSLSGFPFFSPHGTSSREFLLIIYLFIYLSCINLLSVFGVVRFLVAQ